VFDRLFRRASCATCRDALAARTANHQATAEMITVTVAIARSGSRSSSPDALPRCCAAVCERSPGDATPGARLSGLGPGLPGPTRQPHGLAPCGRTWCRDDRVRRR
jgi:hypothetical protein